MDQCWCMPCLDGRRHSPATTSRPAVQLGSAAGHQLPAKVDPGEPPEVGGKPGSVLAVLAQHMQCQPQHFCGNCCALGLAAPGTCAMPNHQHSSSTRRCRLLPGLACCRANLAAASWRLPEEDFQALSSLTTQCRLGQAWRQQQAAPAARLCRAHGSAAAATASVHSNQDLCLGLPSRPTDSKLSSRPSCAECWMAPGACRQRAPIALWRSFGTPHMKLAPALRAASGAHRLGWWKCWWRSTLVPLCLFHVKLCIYTQLFSSAMPPAWCYRTHHRGDARTGPPAWPSNL